ncbi:hypothetical protein [Micromonospora rubida]
MTNGDDERGHNNASTSIEKVDHRIAYISLTVTLAPLFMAAVRIYVVAGGNVSVIKTLGATLNIQSLILGTYLGILPVIFLMTAVGFYIASLSAEMAGRDKKKRVYLGGAIILLAFGVTLQPPRTSVEILIFVTAGTLLGHAGSLTGRVVARRSIAKAALKTKRIPLLGISPQRAVEAGYRPSRRERRFTKRGIAQLKFLVYTAQAVFALFALVQILFAPGMWLPTESIGIRSQKTAIIGYVLEEKDDRITILRRDGLGIEHLKADDIVSRQVCDDKPRQSPTFSAFFGRSIATDKIPVCIGLEAK